jgi:hypothetical protein
VDPTCTTQNISATATYRTLYCNLNHDSPGLASLGVRLLHVSLQAGLDGKPFPAERTGKGTLPPMYPHVGHQVGLPAKCRATLLARVGFGVEPLVHPLAGRLVKLFAAIFAFQAAAAAEISILEGRKVIQLH